MIKSVPQTENLLAWMEGLSDPTRLRLVRLLERNELGVAELCEVLQLPQSTVSRHLKVLLDQGWLRSRRQGTNPKPDRLSVTEQARGAACKGRAPFVCL